MNIKTANKLERLGFDSRWIDWVRMFWTPKKKGKYTMLITDIEYLDDNIENGIFVERTCFDTDLDLSIIHHYFEGNAYIITVSATGKEIGRGIIDGSPFEDCEEYESTRWFWHDCEDEPSFEDYLDYKYIESLIYNQMI